MAYFHSLARLADTAFGLTCMNIVANAVRSLAEGASPGVGAFRVAAVRRAEKARKREPPMIAHLKGRERALEPFGLTGRRAEWVALASLHGGVFTPAQLSDWLGTSRFTVLRLMQAWAERRMVAEETVGGLKVYRVLGAEDVRHRRVTSTEVVVRRLLSFDYVIEHPGLSLAPDRVGEGGRVRGARHRPLPAARPGLPGRDRWRAAVLPARDARRAGLPPRRVRPRRFRLRHFDGATLRGGIGTGGSGRRCGRMDCQSRPSGSRAPGDRLTERGRSSGTGPLRTRPCVPCIRPGPSPRPRREAARVENAIRGMDDPTVEELGGLNGCLRRLVEMRNLLRSAHPEGVIDGHSVWRSSRLSGVQT